MEKAEKRRVGLYKHKEVKLAPEIRRDIRKRAIGG